MNEPGSQLIVQLIPSTVVALRVAAGSKAPGEIIGPTLVASACGATAAVIAAKLLARLHDLREEALESTAKDLPTVFQEMGVVRAVMERRRPDALPDPAAPYFAHLRVREGDEVMAVLAGSLKQNLVFFSNFGAAYVTRFNDIPASTGYGDPVQKLFKFDDGERVVGALSLDPRMPRPELLIGVSRRGYGLRFPLAPHTEASTRSGRRYARPGEGDELIGVVPVGNRDLLAGKVELPVRQIIIRHIES